MKQRFKGFPNFPAGQPVRPAVRYKSDIPIPDDIYVKEQYADLLKIINRLLSLMADHEMDNSQPLGRLRGALLFLKQEIQAKRFPIPGTRGMVSTASYLAGNPMFSEDFPDISKDLYRIVSLVQCHSLIKDRHGPRVIEVLDNCIRWIEEHSSILETELRRYARGLSFEYIELGRVISEGSLPIFPLDAEDWPFISNFKSSVELTQAADKTGNEFRSNKTILSGILSSNWRPRQSQPTPGWEMPDWVKRDDAR